MTWILEVEIYRILDIVGFPANGQSTVENPKYVLGVQFSSSKAKQQLIYGTDRISWNRSTKFFQRRIPYRKKKKNFPYTPVQIRLLAITHCITYSRTPIAISDFLFFFHDSATAVAARRRKSKIVLNDSLSNDHVSALQ